MSMAICNRYVNLPEGNLEGHRQVDLAWFGLEKGIETCWRSVDLSWWWWGGWWWWSSSWFEFWSKFFPLLGTFQVNSHDSARWILWDSWRLACFHWNNWHLAGNESIVKFDLTKLVTLFSNYLVEHKSCQPLIWRSLHNLWVLAWVFHYEMWQNDCCMRVLWRDQHSPARCWTSSPACETCCRNRNIFAVGSKKTISIWLVVWLPWILFSH